MTASASVSLVDQFIDVYRIMEGLHMMRAEDSGQPYKGRDSWTFEDQEWLNQTIAEILALQKKGGGQ